MFAVAYSNEAEALAQVEFVEATKDILERSPEVRRGFRAVQELYSESHGFALAKSSEISLTKHIQGMISSYIATGKAVPEFEKFMEDLTPWSRAYAETVFRTNLASAYASGRMQQASSPELDDFIVAIRRVASLDADTRPNHRAAHGLVARKRDPIWLSLGVPAGYNCRCGFEWVDRFQAERMNIPARATAPAGAYNDPGFENRIGFEVWGLTA